MKMEQTDCPETSANKIQTPGNSLIVFSFEYLAVRLKYTELESIELWKLDFCLTVHHQLGKVIQTNQLDATMIY